MMSTPVNARCQEVKGDLHEVEDRVGAMASSALTPHLPFHDLG